MFEDADSIYVGLRRGLVRKYVRTKEDDAHGLNPSERKRQRHDHNTFEFSNAGRWDGFQGAVTAMIVGPREKDLFASDTQGNLYVMSIDEDEDEDGHDDGF